MINQMSETESCTVVAIWVKNKNSKTLFPLMKKSLDITSKT